MFRLMRGMTGAAVVAAMLIACNLFAQDQAGSGAANKMQAAATAVANIRPSAAAATQPANKSVTGMVTFTADGADVKFMGDIHGLSPGKHGFHIHVSSDLSSPTLASAGAHYDMGGHKHGGPDTADHHTGDLGNITADASGDAHAMGTLKGATLDQLIGKSVIVHAAEDDMKTDPSGNSGGRVAGGAIEKK